MTPAILVHRVCLRCTWEWDQRKAPDKRPAQCPHCKSPYWDRERQQPKQKRSKDLQENL